MIDPMLMGILSDRLSEAISSLAWLVAEAKRIRDDNCPCWYHWQTRMARLRQALQTLEEWQEEVGGD